MAERGVRLGVLAAAGRLLACGSGLAVLATSGLGWYEYHSLAAGLSTSNALDHARSSTAMPLDSSVNVLLIGLDSRKDMDGNDLPPQFVQDELHAGASSEVGGYNTNTLIVLHIPAGGGKVSALSIPRDDYVRTYGADGRKHKIKEAYGYAKAAAEDRLADTGLDQGQLEQQSREAGREATLATVQNFLGIPIDHFAEVNLLGFYDIAKALGPIQVCLNHATSDPAVQGQGSGFLGHAGLNTLNASQALAFVRQRHNLADGDLDRTHRQQAFLASVEDKLKHEGVFNDLNRMQSLLGVMKKDVVIDNRWDVLDFALRASDLTGGNVEFNTLPITGFATIGKEDVNTVDTAQVQEIVRGLFGRAPASAPVVGASPTAAPTTAPITRTTSDTVDVYNASAVAGAASRESQALVAAGYQGGRVGTASPRSRTTVAYGSGAQEGAKDIAARYGAAAEPSSRVVAGHIVVTLGSNYSPPAGVEDDPGAPSSASMPAMQGPPVTMGGIPCVN